MDELNEYFLELPEHLRHLVNEGAPLKVKPIHFETLISGVPFTFLAGTWPVVSDQKNQSYQSQIFVTLADENSNVFARLEKQSLCTSQYELENYPLGKIWNQLRGINNDLELVRHFKIEGINEPLELCASIRNHSLGWWKPDNKIIHPITRFSHQIFSSYREFLELPDEVVLKRIHFELSNIDHEINLSRRWMYWGTKQRDEEALFCQRGTWSELETLFRHVLRVIPRQGQIEWSLASDETPDFSYFLDDEDAIAEFEERWLPFTNLWSEKIYEYFQPRYFSSITSQFLCIQTYAWENNFFSISEDTPTAHELLEAQLHLSQWAHKHCTPTEAATLLQFES